MKAETKELATHPPEDLGMAILVGVDIASGWSVSLVRLTFKKKILLFCRVAEPVAPKSEAEIVFLIIVYGSQFGGW